MCNLTIILWLENKCESEAKVKVIHSCPTFATSPGYNYLEVAFPFFLVNVFPTTLESTQVSHCRWILYQPSCQGRQSNLACKQRWSICVPLKSHLLNSSAQGDTIRRWGLAEPGVEGQETRSQDDEITKVTPCALPRPCGDAGRRHLSRKQ